MQRFGGHRRFERASAFAALAALVAVSMLAGCSCAPQQQQISTQPAVSETPTPAVEPPPLPTETTPPPPSLPVASGPVYEATSSGEHSAERKAILAAAHAYVGDPKPFVVNQIVVQQPYALASLISQGGATWAVALRRTGSGWQGLWRQKLASASKSALKGAGVIDAPDLVAHFYWVTPEKPVTQASAAAYIKSTLSAGTTNPDAKVKSVDIKVFEKDYDSTVWVGAVIENDLDGGIVFAKKPAGKSWVIIDFGTGIDGSEMEGKAPSSIAAKFKAAFPQ
jgi:hypothetical protein